MTSATERETIATKTNRNNVVAMNRRPPSSIPALLRSMGWLTSVAAIVVLSYVLHRWPADVNAVATGILGVSYIVARRKRSAQKNGKCLDNIAV